MNFVRSVLSTVTFTPRLDHQTVGKLRVLLLKSPTHLGHFTSRVNRLYNEDKYSANVLNINGLTMFNFNIFDGHGGAECSCYLSQHLSQAIEQVDVNNDELRDGLIRKYLENVGGYWRRWYRSRKDNFIKMLNSNNQIKLESLPTKDDLGVRLPLSFLGCDYKFFETENKSGSTCTSLLLETLYADPTVVKTVVEDYYFDRNTISKLTIAHVGDTKAIIVDKNGEAHALTTEHHPSNPVEASRLRRYMANFVMADSFGEERFIALANTRAFGDVNYKHMGVTAEPDISELIIGDSATISSKLNSQEIRDYTVGGLGGDEGFIVLCSDGVTNEVTDQEIADIVTNTFNMRGHRATPQNCSEEVVKFVEYIGGDDNATCMVIRLTGWGKWPIRDRTGDLRQQRMDDLFRREDRG